MLQVIANRIVYDLLLEELDYWHERFPPSSLPLINLFVLNRSSLRSRGTWLSGQSPDYSGIDGRGREQVSWLDRLTLPVYGRLARSNFAAEKLTNRKNYATSRADLKRDAAGGTPHGRDLG